MAAALSWRPAGDADWRIVPMTDTGNDRWSASFPIERVGRYEFTVEAWLDEFGKFQYELSKKHAAGVDLKLELQEGQALVRQAAKLPRRRALKDLEKQLRAASADQQRILLLAPETARMMAQADARPFAVRLRSPVPVDAERVGAGFASWYELFPRSQSPTPGRHGTFDDVIARLPAIRDMGFDVLYFPPIHPIGKTNRKGRNNTLTPGPDDPGSPYAIGSEDGGHDAIERQLGTLEDFRRLSDAARGHGMELALDFAIQCSPDHPWLRQHPDWFIWRPDGTIRYAENPPKRYEDIVNVAFYAEGALPSLWVALRDVVLFWVEQGVRIFRVDNPHTKPFPFWEWMISDIRARYPDVIFLAEAFTRPKVMYRLAKVGFSQSYTYFTWRNTAREMREYLTELTTTAPRDFFRPHFFVNTPDINPEFLHASGRPGFLRRAALAATLSGLWGVYNGFELCESKSLNGREEYLDSEKYEIRAWDHDRPGNIIAEIRRLNHIRRTNPALHSHLGVTFLPCSNDQVLCFAKATEDHDNVVICVISFDPVNIQDFSFEVPASVLGLPAGQTVSGQSFVADDLMGDGTSSWQPGWRQARLDPAYMPFALWRLRSIEG
jgi:starch synthase (maltosyl-transferring)